MKYLVLQHIINRNDTMCLVIDENDTATWVAISKQLLAIETHLMYSNQTAVEEVLKYPKDEIINLGYFDDLKEMYNTVSMLQLL